MDKSLFVFVFIGLSALYLVTHFMGEVESEDDNYKNNTYKVEHQYTQYQREDSVGRPILVVNDIDKKVQVAAWNASPLKVEFLGLFPKYTEMKTLIQERIRGDYLQKKLIGIVNDVEGKFFSGSINTEQAKRTLDSLKVP